MCKNPTGSPEGPIMPHAIILPFPGRRVLTDLAAILLTLDVAGLNEFGVAA